MTQLRLPPVALALIASLLMIGLLALLWPASESTVFSSWPGKSAAAPPPRQLVAEARPLPLIPVELRLDGGLYAGQEEGLRQELAEAMAYVAERFGSQPSGAVTASLKRDDGCGLHGVAYTDIRDARVFSCDAIPRDRAVAIMAHEFTHQLAQDRYGPPHLAADLILSEGVATWAAGRYWLAGHPDFRSYVREQRRAGSALPLATHYAGLGAAGMNTLYYQWASFVEFLIGEYGRESFDRLYVSGAGDPGSADYQGVYGKPLAELEREWERWLDER